MVAVHKLIVGFVHVKLNEPVLFVNVNVGIAIVDIVKFVVVLQPPAAVTVTFVTPELKPEPTV